MVNVKRENSSAGEPNLQRKGYDTSLEI
jgi:hypothetical protein